MQVRDFMSKDPVCCNPESPLGDVARLMVEHHCGEIPVVEPGNSKLVGVITDRDITCRTVAQGRNPVPVVDETGRCCGIVSQADIAHVGSEKIAGELLKEVSRPTSIPSRVGGA